MLGPLVFGVWCLVFGRSLFFVFVASIVVDFIIENVLIFLIAVGYHECFFLPCLGLFVFLVELNFLFFYLVAIISSCGLILLYLIAGR